MSNWIKWWKDKTFMTVLGIALGAMVISFILAYFISWGWIPACAVALAGGYFIKRVIIKRIDELFNNDSNT